MKNKTHTVPILRNFFVMVKNQFQNVVKNFRSDNGSKFLSKECQNLLSEFGILHQRTCVYTPQKNGRVERKHRTIVQVARSILFGATLPVKFWDEAILHATYLLNRWPSIVVDWKTPFEVLYERPVDYAKLKNFRCLAYATVTSPHKDKFTPRAFKCVFMGYTLGNKGYKLFDYVTNKFIVSRDVIFHQQVYPFWK